MKGLSRKAIRYAEEHGYSFERQNCKGVLFYRHSSGHEVGIRQGIDDPGYRLVTQQIDRARGIGPDLTQKRHPDEIKARQARDRLLLKQEKQRHAARLDDLAKQQAALLFGGVGDALTLREVKAIEHLIEAEKRHHNDTVRQMTAMPGAA